MERLQNEFLAHLIIGGDISVRCNCKIDIFNDRVVICVVWLRLSRANCWAFSSMTLMWAILDNILLFSFPHLKQVFSEIFISNINKLGTANFFSKHQDHSSIAIYRVWVSIVFIALQLSHKVLNSRCKFLRNNSLVYVNVSAAQSTKSQLFRRNVRCISP